MNETNVSLSNSSNVPSRKIHSPQDIPQWLISPGYKDYLNFIKQLNEFAKYVHNKGLNRKDSITIEVLVVVVKMLEGIDELVEKVKPFEDDKNQRFGNKAYRVWYEEMKKLLSDYLCQENGFTEEESVELLPYLYESFGNQQRIDYGTGHEMCFIIFLMGIYKLKLVKNQSLPKEELKRISHQLLTIFATVYMPLIRKIQINYRLEPAGSHGAFSLDDFQFLPFFFGSAQLIGHPDLEPKTFPDVKISEKFKDDYMFYSAIDFIHSVKKGPFFEHSNKLWDISGVEDWSKINKGLLAMYTKEYLCKFPILQHIVFGKTVLPWT